MAANGTPQSALYAQRPANTTRDRSMEQQYTNSGNPYGYTPAGYSNYYSGQDPNLGRYAPPQGYGPYQPMNFPTGPYAYNSPNNYGTGTAPSGASYMPQYQAPPGMGGNAQPAQGGQPVYAAQPVSWNNPQVQMPSNSALAAAMANPQYNPQFRQQFANANINGAPQPAQATAGQTQYAPRGVVYNQGMAGNAQPSPVVAPPVPHVFTDRHGVQHNFGHLSFTPRIR